MSTSKLLIFTLLALAALALLFWNQDLPSSSANAYLNLADSVAYVGMATCRSCSGTGTGAGRAGRGIP